ncbi:YnbE family lipoprotein [Azospirillum sp. A39]|uniref:YnbE family lipoprotein n=1 Tax=Azospirillum sp. A39 TaxID=3462279 RepID=UPI0040461198
MDVLTLRRPTVIGMVAGIALSAAACAPTVKLEAPERPIEINLNIRIEQEVRVKVERDLEKAILEDPALFGVPADADGAPAGKTDGGAS